LWLSDCSEPSHYPVHAECIVILEGLYVVCEAVNKLKFADNELNLILDMVQQLLLDWWQRYVNYLVTVIYWSVVSILLKFFWNFLPLMLLSVLCWLNTSYISAL